MTITMKAGVVLVAGMLAMNNVAVAEPKKAKKVELTSAQVKAFKGQVKKEKARQEITPHVNAVVATRNRKATEEVEKAAKELTKAQGDLAAAKGTEKEESAVSAVEVAEEAKKVAEDKQKAVRAEGARLRDAMLNDSAEGTSSWVDTITSAPRKAMNYFWTEATGAQRAYRIGAVVGAAALTYLAWTKYNAEADEDDAQA